MPSSTLFFFLSSIVLFSFLIVEGQDCIFLFYSWDETTTTSTQKCAVHDGRLCGKGGRGIRIIFLGIVEYAVVRIREEKTMSLLILGIGGGGGIFFIQNRCRTSFVVFRLWWSSFVSLRIEGLVFSRIYLMGGIGWVGWHDTSLCGRIGGLPKRRRRGHRDGKCTHARTLTPALGARRLCVS